MVWLFLKKCLDIFTFAQNAKVIEKGDLVFSPLENQHCEGDHSMKQHDVVEVQVFHLLNSSTGDESEMNAKTAGPLTPLSFGVSPHNPNGQAVPVPGCHLSALLLLLQPWLLVWLSPPSCQPGEASLSIQVFQHPASPNGRPPEGGCSLWSP